MLLTITTTHEPATDLGFLLHKHPERVQEFSLPFGEAHVFYPEAGAERCTAALLLDVDPVGLVRGRGRAGRDDSGPLGRYVNDKPYAASSFLSVAIANVFGSALSGSCKTRPELVDTVMPLEARLAVLPARGGVGLLRRLFEPLGYEVEANRHPLDARFPDWGDSVYHDVTIRRRETLRELLAHLYVLVPVLDDDKHYFIGQAEVEKLMRHGEGWLAGHPEREEIATRYLLRQRSLARQALERLSADDGEDVAAADAQGEQQEAVIEQPIRLNAVRMEAVEEVLVASGARSVVDLGCGEGRLLQRLLRRKEFERVVGLDTSHRSLERAALRLNLEEMAPRKRERIDLWHGSLTYRDERLQDFDAAALVEVVEHVDPSRLTSLERVVFEAARPRVVVVTTPNVEYNVRFEGLAAGAFRHGDHRFEWTRAEFEAWAGGVAERHGYAVRFAPVGEVDPEVGPPSQMAVFDRDTAGR